MPHLENIISAHNKLRMRNELNPLSCYKKYAETLILNGLIKVFMEYAPKYRCFKLTTILYFVCVP